MRSRIAGTGSYLPAQVLTNDRAGAARRHQRRMDPRAHRDPAAPHRGRRRADVATWRWRASRRALAARRHRARRHRPHHRRDHDAGHDLSVDGVHPAGQARRPRRRRRSTCRRCARGFVYALALADKMVATRDGASNALVVGAEIYSRILDWNDRGTCVLFGDGAGAVVLVPRRRRASCDASACRRPLRGILCVPGQVRAAQSPARRSCTMDGQACSSSR